MSSPVDELGGVDPQLTQVDGAPHLVAAETELRDTVVAAPSQDNADCMGARVSTSSTGSGRSPGLECARSR